MNSCDNRLVRAAKNNWMLCIPFIAIFALLRVSPMMYDGWAGPYYYQQFGGIFNWVNYVFVAMRDWINGRVASNFFCGILESFTSEIPLDLTSTLVITAMLLCIMHLFPSKNKVLAAMVFSSLFILMPYQTRTYVLQIASMAYLPPMLFLLVMMILIKQYTQEAKKWHIPALCILSMIACTWMENSSVAYGVVLAFYCLERMVSSRKFSWPLCTVVALALLSGLYMITAPGTRMSRATGYGMESFVIFDKQQLYVHVQMIFGYFIINNGISNFCIALIAATASLVCVASSWKKKGFALKLLLLVANIVAVIGFWKLCHNTGEFQYIAEINTTQYNVLLTERPKLICLLTLGYLMWIPVNALVLCKWDKHVLFLILFSLVSTGCVLLTIQTGARIYSPLYVIQVFLLCIVVLQIPLGDNEFCGIKKCCMAIIAAVFVLGIDYEAQLCERVSNVQAQRMQVVEEIQALQAVGEGTDLYYRMPIFNSRDIYLQGETSIGTFHYPQFLQRHGLLPDTKLVFTNELVYLSVDQADESGLVVRVIDHDTTNWTYDFTVYYREDANETFVPIINETGLTQSNYYAPLINGDGDYQIVVTLINPENGFAKTLSQVINHTVRATGE